MRKVLLIFLLLIQISLYSQKTVKDRFNVKIQEEAGDLNNDGRADKVIISMDTVSATVPVRLQIFLSQPDGKLQLHTSSADIIEPQYPHEKKGAHTENQIPSFSIDNGNLSIVTDIRGGHTVYIFRYKNKNFELIKVQKNVWDGNNTTTETEFNLLTAIKTEKTEVLGKEKSKENKYKFKVGTLVLKNLKQLEQKF